MTSVVNMNQAIYVFSRDQLEDMGQRCGFVSDIGQNPFYRQLRRAMDAQWNYISVGVSESGLHHFSGHLQWPKKNNAFRR